MGQELRFIKRLDPAVLEMRLDPAVLEMRLDPAVLRSKAGSSRP